MDATPLRDYCRFGGEDEITDDTTEQEPVQE